MENRPAPLRSRRVCRFCLTESEPLNFIYERDHSKPFQVPLTLQIMSCVAIEVYSADGMPQMICTMCRWNLDRSYKFKQQCKKADEALRAYPMTGVLPRPFPPITNESPESSSKRSADQRLSSDAKKARVDNGDRERRERERDRQDSGIKVDRNELYKEESRDTDGDEEALDDKELDRKLEPGEIRVHACDQCDRTFPLRQALQLHVERAHRERNYKCTRHEKVHREDLRYSCPHCDREFFTHEELEKHEDTSHKTAKPFHCNICNKRFTYKQGLERHEMLHAEDKSFTCEYCKEAFRTSTKLARHLQTHAGHRPYLCKLCPRSFLLSHHLTRHMRSHSVEKRHSCEDCGKAFKRKESLEVHQLTHTKRSSTGMGLTCDICQESCRNRADYVTHIKQHIEAGEKMGPDGLQPDKEDPMETESEEDVEEEPYTDGDDEYQPPRYVAKKYPKKIVQQEEESEEEVEQQQQLQRAEKDERKEQVVFVRGKDGQIVKKTIKTLMPIQRREVAESPKTSSAKASSSAAKAQSSKQAEETSKARVDDTEAEEQVKDAAAGQGSRGQVTVQTPIKKEEPDVGTPKSANTVKVIKRIVVRKPAGGTETVTTTSTPTPKDVEAAKSTPGAAKITKRVIVRRIIRQGDTTREVIMNPDGTIIDPSELAKLPTGNVVKRVVVKKPVEKAPNVVQVLQSSPEQSAVVSVAPKFELKTSQTASVSTKATVQKTEMKKPPSPVVLSKDDQETKEKLVQLEKQVEQQRLKIEELQAKKQQEYDNVDDMLPERHDSEDEQELPLKRVFVKRKQSIYDEEQEYHDTDVSTDTKEAPVTTEVVDKSKEKSNGKKVVYIKTEEPSEVEQMSRELSSMLDSADNVAKIQESVLSNLTEISSVTEKVQGEKIVLEAEKESESTEQDITIDSKKKIGEVKIEKLSQESSVEEPMDISEAEISKPIEEPSTMEQVELSEAADIFEASDSPIADKSAQILDDSVVALSKSNDTINLNDTNDSQDSLEDKLSQMEG